MKKIFAVLFVAASLVACDNAANTTGEKKDSLDSVGGAKKEAIDSMSEMRKDMVDSTTEKQKDMMDKMDSMNHKKDSAAH